MTQPVEVNKEHPEILFWANNPHNPIHPTRLEHSDILFWVNYKTDFCHMLDLIPDILIRFRASNERSTPDRDQHTELKSIVSNWECLEADLSTKNWDILNYGDLYPTIISCLRFLSSGYIGLLGEEGYKPFALEVYRFIDMVRNKDKDYGSSWCRRGGAGAFFVTVRKVDRLSSVMGTNHYLTGETLQDTVVDLFGYLMLILTARLSTVRLPTVGEHEPTNSLHTYEDKRIAIDWLYKPKE